MSKDRNIPCLIGDIGSRIPKPGVRVSGRLVPGQTVLDGEGLIVNGGVVGVETDANDADGRNINIASAGGIGNRCGYISTWFTATESRYNPYFSGKFKLGQIVTQRFWAGLFNADPMALDLPGSVGAISSLGIRCSTTAPNTNFVAYTSTGMPLENLQDFPVPVPADTLLHTFAIEVKNAGRGVTITLDNQSVSFVMPAVGWGGLPPITFDLGFAFAISATAAVVKNLQLYNAYVEADR